MRRWKRGRVGRQSVALPICWWPCRYLSKGQIVGSRHSEAGLGVLAEAGPAIKAAPHKQRQTQQPQRATQRSSASLTGIWALLRRPCCGPAQPSIGSDRPAHPTHPRSQAWFR